MSNSDASLTEAQWDLLADYIGGALDGDPRHHEVTALIESDPGWRRAHAELAEAVGAVHDDLRALAEAPVGPIPEDVAARLVFPAPLSSVPSAHPVAEPSSADLGPAVVPLASARKRRMPRWALPATIAAGVLVFAAAGVTGLVNGADTSEDTASSAGGAPEAAALPMMAQTVLTSGRDYTPASAESLASEVRQRGGVAAEELSSPLSAADSGTTGALARLTEPFALRACLEAISLEHGVAAAAIRLVDYASFQGSPGMLVLFTDTAGGDMVWVAGPECGVAGMGADTRYRAPVG